MPALSPRRRAWVLLLAALIGVAITARLGIWQLSRAAQKEALQAALDARAQLPALDAGALARDADLAARQRFRPVHLRGHWLASRTVFLENRQMNGRTGFYVVTPLALEDQAGAVLVQRGWAPRDMQDRTRLPSVPTQAGSVELDGRVAPPPARLYEFAADAGGAIRQNLDMARFAAESGLALLPMSVLQADSAATAGDGLLRAWPRPALDVDKHYGYAFQWFALAALMTGLYVWFQLIRPRLRHDGA